MKRESTSQQLRLGIFVILGLLVFIATVYFIGSKQNIFGKTITISARFNNVSGLQSGNNVRYSGINVGTVRSISMINDTIICVEMMIEADIVPHIKKNAVATITSDGLVGSMIVNVVPGKGESHIIAAGDEIQSYSRIRTDDILNTLNVTNENAALLTVDLLKITKEITAGKGTIGTLLNDTLMSKDIKKSLQHLKVASGEAASLISNANQMVNALQHQGSLIGVLKDTAMAGKINGIVDNIDRSSKALQQITLNLNATILNAKDGQGVINYLSNDPKLVKQIDSTIVHIESASYRLDENMRAMQDNFLLRGYFKKKKANESAKKKK